MAISLLLELTMQRASLSHILDAILLLLHLSDVGPCVPDKNKRAHKVEEEEEQLKGRAHRVRRESGEAEIFRLVSFLRRLASIPTPSLPPLWLKAGEDIEVSVQF